MEVNKKVEQHEPEELSGSDKQLQEKLSHAVETQSALKTGLGCASIEGRTYP